MSCHYCQPGALCPYHGNAEMNATMNALLKERDGLRVALVKAAEHERAMENAIRDALPHLLHGANRFAFLGDKERTKWLIDSHNALLAAKERK